MTNTDVIRSHPNFGLQLRDPKDRAALDDAWERKWFEIDPKKETASEVNRKACREYKLSRRAQAKAAKLQREIKENFGGAK